MRLLYVLAFGILKTGELDSNIVLEPRSAWKCCRRESNRFFPLAFHPKLEVILVSDFFHVYVTMHMVREIKVWMSSEEKTGSSFSP